MMAKCLGCILAASLALGGVAACKSGGPTDPDSPAGLTFNGTITSSGSALSGLRVYLMGDASQSAYTDAHGFYSFRGLSGSNFFITALLPYHSFAPAGYALGAQSRSGLDFTGTTGPYGYTVGTTAPDFAALDQDGRVVSLHSYLGKVILLDFCADWCGSCRAEAPELESLYQSYKDQGLQVLTVLIDGSAAAWASEYKSTFPILEDKTRMISNPYDTSWIPVNVIIDRTMTIRYREAIDYDADLFTSIIRAYL